MSDWEIEPGWLTDKLMSGKQLNFDWLIDQIVINSFRNNMRNWVTAKHLWLKEMNEWMIDWLYAFECKLSESN